MEPLTSPLFFLVILTSTAVVLHLYLWRRLVRDTDLAWGWRQILRVTLILFTLGLPVTRYMSHQNPTRALMILNALLLTWFTTTLILSGWLFIIDIVRMGWMLLRGTVPSLKPKPLGNPKYSLLFMEHNTHIRPANLLWNRALATTAVVLTLACTLSGLIAAFRVPAISNVNVTLPHLPTGLEGLKIAQLSDLHAGPLISRGFLETIVEETNRAKPDLIVLTGDLIDGSVAKIGPIAEILGKLRAPLGVVVVNGNHEFYSGVDEWDGFFEKLGMTVLRNSSLTISRNGDVMCVAGVEDWNGAEYCENCGPDVKKAISICPQGSSVLLLSHQPKILNGASEAGVDYVLAGHTHGGQLLPFGYLVKWFQPVLSGAETQGETHMYVSRGTGFSGPMVRLGVPSELPLHILHSGQEKKDQALPQSNTSEPQQRRIKNNERS